MSYTKGPWIPCDYGAYGDYDGKCRVILGEGGDIRTAVVLGFDNKENQANAALIAAAPDLLEALEIAMGHIDMASLEVSHCKDAELIRAAIKKAMGEA